MTTTNINKKTKIGKDLFLFKGSTLFDFVYIPIKEFEWKKFLKGSSTALLDVVRIFYEGFIHKEENYTYIKGKHIYVDAIAINNLYGLPNNPDALRINT